MPTYDRRSYITVDDMLKAIARGWLRDNAVGSKITPVMAAECAATWRLADGHMQVEGYDIEDLTLAFAQVMQADDRDRRAERGGGPSPPDQRFPHRKRPSGNVLNQSTLAERIEWAVLILAVVTAAVATGWLAHLA